MNCELRRLSPDDGRDVYDMLQELPKDENEFKMWLVKSNYISNGIGLEEWMVPQNTYWLYIDGRPVGMGKLRHYLTDKLMEEGGHCGYAIRPSQRSKGYGKILLKVSATGKVGGCGQKAGHAESSERSKQRCTLIRNA